MSRFEGKFLADGRLADPEVAALFGRLSETSRQISDSERQEAIVCFLSASDGWRSASKRLSGHFAGDMRVEPTRFDTDEKE